MGVPMQEEQPSANASWGAQAKPSSAMTNMLLSQVMAGRNSNNVMSNNVMSNSGMGNAGMSSGGMSNGGRGMSGMSSMSNVSNAMASMNTGRGMSLSANDIQQQRQQQQQQQFNLLAAQQQQQHQQQHQSMEQGKRELMDHMEQQPTSRLKLEEQPQQAPGIPRTITLHTHLLERGNIEGARLYSYYILSIDELYRLPPTPSDEEYCESLNMPDMTADMLPGSHLAALSASRFAEIALGALVSNDVSLGMELCNAVVHCLRESVQEPVQTPITFEVAKSYFLLGTFRALRGDMARYFKYRRVCMTYLSKLEVCMQLTDRARRVAFFRESTTHLCAFSLPGQSSHFHPIGGDFIP
jgi:hypothetical protein